MEYNWSEKMVASSKKSQKARQLTYAFFENEFYKNEEIYQSLFFTQSFALSFYTIVNSYNKSKNNAFRKKFTKDIRTLLKIKPSILKHEKFGVVSGDKNKYLYEIHKEYNPDPFRVAFALSADKKKIALLYIFLENKITWTRVLSNRLPNKETHEKELGFSFHIRG